MGLPPHILIVDPDQTTQEVIAVNARRHGMRTAIASDAASARHRLQSEEYDIITLEAALPDEPGLTFLAWIRARVEVPVIFVTEFAEEADRIIGLDLGADDYVKKPFHPSELIARINAVVRRTKGRAAQEIIGFEGWKLVLSRRRLITPSGVEITVSAGEFDLLVVLAQRPNRALSSELICHVLQNQLRSHADASTIRVGISRLRNKLSAAGAPIDLIRTIRGSGYMFAIASSTK